MNSQKDPMDDASDSQILRDVTSAAQEHTDYKPEDVGKAVAAIGVDTLVKLTLRRFYVILATIVVAVAGGTVAVMGFISSRDSRMDRIESTVNVMAGKVTTLSEDFEALSQVVDELPPDKFEARVDEIEKRLREVERDNIILRARLEFLKFQQGQGAANWPDEDVG